jgi:leader peptidase (prepilin peptidase)/N-methyltransferase
MNLALSLELGAFLAGLLLGSFLNVCISRLPEHRSIVRPRSACPKCSVEINWYDNVPILSWLALRGRCRVCRLRISWRYPAVELGVGLWFVVCLNSYIGSAFNAFYFSQPQVAGAPPLWEIAFATAILGFLLIGLMVMDWQTHKLPDAFTLTGTAIGFVLVCCQAVFLGPHEYELLLKGRNPLTSPGNVVDRGNVILTGPEHLVLGRLLAICAAAGLVLTIRLLYKLARGREGMGLGDAKLMAMIAAFLGFWPAMLTLFLGMVLCAAYALFLMARGKVSAATRLPLGSFLAAGGLAAAFIGAPLIAWYSSLL